MVNSDVDRQGPGEASERSGDSLKHKEGGLIISGLPGSDPAREVLAAIGPVAPEPARVKGTPSDVSENRFSTTSGSNILHEKAPKPA